MCAFGDSYSKEGVGNPGKCMVQCTTSDNDGMTWQQVGDCLQKRVKEVNCMPQYIERTDNNTLTWSSKSISTAETIAATRPGSATDATQERE